MDDEVGRVRRIVKPRDILVVRGGHFIGSLPYQGGRVLCVMTKDGVKSFELQHFVVKIDDANGDANTYETLAVLDENKEIAPSYADVPWPFSRWVRDGGQVLPPLEGKASS